MDQDHRTRKQERTVRVKKMMVMKEEEFLQIHHFSLIFYLSHLFFAPTNLHSFAFLGLLITVRNAPLALCSCFCCFFWLSFYLFLSTLLGYLGSGFWWVFLALLINLAYFLQWHLNRVLRMDLEEGWM